ncbi:MAG: transposase [Loktanella sp.]|nr:transposase [Loktanella sp.]
MVHVSGFYAWLKEPLSQRAQDDERQTELIRQAWEDSGKVYGYRKLTDDLRDQGERVSQNRVARLASLAGISAQIGYRRRPGRYPTRDAARQDVFEYIEMLYNPKRKHTNNGMLSPVDFETRQQKLNQAGV